MAALVDSGEVATERLEAEVCTLAAQIAAATCRFVEMIAELDRREAWAEWGCRSMAQWLSWKCGMGLVAARTHVRVGRALAELPVTKAAFAAGELSFSKVRAVVRVAKATNEAELVAFAKLTTASQLEASVRAYERTSAGPEAVGEQVDRRSWRTVHEDDGSVTVVMRMSRDSYEHFERAIGRVLDEAPPDPENDSAESRCIDAVDTIVQNFLAGRSDRVPTEVVIHVDDEDLDAGNVSPVVERMLCDGAVRIVTPNREMRRRRHTIPIALRRTVEARDKQVCRFPSCSNRRGLHVHHIVYVTNFGPTIARNCILLCPFHHRMVHDGGWKVFGDANQIGQLHFVAPGGRRRIQEHEPPAVAGRAIELVPDIARIRGTAIATATGDRMDLASAVDLLVNSA